MIIRVIERDPLDLVQKTRARWVEQFQKYLGDIVGFITALMGQSGFYVMCYMADHFLPLSIGIKSEQDLPTAHPFYEMEIEIEDRTDPRLTKEDPLTGNMTNIWFGPYTRTDELVQHLQNRFKYYIDLAIKRLKDPSFKYPFEQ